MTGNPLPQSPSPTQWDPERPGAPGRRSGGGALWSALSSGKALDQPAAEAALLVLARGATLSLPFALLYSRAVAEVLIGIIDGAFLLHAAAARDWGWLRRPWTLATLPFWSWLVLCSALGPGGWPSEIQALVAIRFYVCAAALGDWVLARAATRRWLWAMVAASAAWIAIECWQQYLFGVNIFGDPRCDDGSLTGPFNKPRAGAAFALILFPALLPAAAAFITGRDSIRASLARPIAGALLVVASVATMVLIGQRMPALLMLLGIATTALLLPRTRLALAGALLVGSLVIAATPVISPPTYAKLVVHFRQQMTDFPRSPYGLLFTRATVMAEDHPLLGLGFRGFRISCDEARYDAGIPWLGIRDTAHAGPERCNLHPHNFYLEAASSSGFPGLACFAGMVVVWLTVLGRGLMRVPDPVRVGLFVTVLMALWPLASTSEFFSVPNCGWLFLMLGWGFAEYHAGSSAGTITPGR